jgi:imidazolonepropionase-like amidohydrolase
MAVLPAAALQLQYPVIETVSHRGFGPPSRKPFKEAKQEYDRRIRQLREFIEQARRYEKAKAAGGPAFEPDVKLEAMLPVLAGKVPVAVRADRIRAIRDAMWLAAQEKVRVVIVGGAEAAKAAPDLNANRIPVVLGPALSLPLEEDDPYDARYTAASELYKAGVKFSFGSFSTAFARNLPYQAATAVAFGLPPKEGLKAVTLNAAEIWGAGSELGSIDKGKWADLIVTDGDPLEARTNIKQAFINGKPASLETKHTRLYKQYLERP